MGYLSHRDVISSLAEMASPLFQSRVWLEVESPWQSSYIECIARLFDDSGLHDALSESSIDGDEIDSLLTEIDNLTDQIDFSSPQSEIVADQRFIRCSRIAADILPFVMLHSNQ